MMNWQKNWAAFGALATGIICLLPPVLIILFGATAAALFPRWLDVIVLPVFLALTVLAVYLWIRGRKNTS